MLVSSLTLGLGLAGLAAAAPVASGPQYPATSQSQGFLLVVNVTDPSQPLAPQIQNQYIASIHVGAGLGIVGVTGQSNARIFYQNGTADEYKYLQSTVISDGATPTVPFGISLWQDNGTDVVSTARLNGGFGTKGVAISSFPEPYAFLLPETFAVCEAALDYYHGAKYLVVKQADTTVDADGTINYNIPEGCAPVRLIPQCTTLNTLAPGSYASHDYALNSTCYEDVSSINWSQYGP